MTLGSNSFLAVGEGGVEWIVGPQGWEWWGWWGTRWSLSSSSSWAVILLLLTWVPLREQREEEEEGEVGEEEVWKRYWRDFAKMRQPVRSNEWSAEEVRWKELRETNIFRSNLWRWLA
jgi:hypothetical protein